MVKADDHRTKLERAGMVILHGAIDRKPLLVKRTQIGLVQAHSEQGAVVFRTTDVGYWVAETVEEIADLIEETVVNREEPD